MPRDVHDKFVEIKIHTAKCDNCNKHNTAIIFRCQTCGQQCCTPCWQRKGGDDKHKLNGGDQGFTLAGEVLGRKRKSTVVSEGRRVRQNTAMIDKDGDDENNEDDNGGCGRHRFRKSTETEPTAISSKQFPENESSTSILTAVDRLLSRAIPSGLHASILSRLRPHPPTCTVAVSHQATTLATTNALSSTYNPPHPPSASDHEGIMALLRAAEHIENDMLLSPSPPGASQRLSVPRNYEDEGDDEEWGQDAQARSPLFTPEDIDLETQSDGGGAEAWRTQGEDMMLQMDGAQDEVAGIDVDGEEIPARRMPNRRQDMDDGYDEETEYEDWQLKIGGAARGPSREADEAGTSRGLDRYFMRATQRDRRR